MQRVEDLNWNYQTLETEYSFLEKLVNEQKDDLKKAKSWHGVSIPKTKLRVKRILTSRSQPKAD